VAKTQEDIAEPQHPDLLAAVVLHVLVTEGQQGISLERVARECERDPDDAAERREVETALEILVRDELAVPEPGTPDAERSLASLGADPREGPRFRPTRAAVRAAELRFSRTGLLAVAQAGVACCSLWRRRVATRCRAAALRGAVRARPTA
jgi:hypothetical protein